MQVSQMKKITAILCILSVSFSVCSEVQISWAQAQTCAIQADGKIAVAGNTLIGTVNQCIAVRYTANGLFDNAFGNMGTQTNQIGSYSQIQMIKIQNTDQKIVAVGNASINDVTYVLLNRYNSDGTLDDQFGDNGTVTSLFGDGATAMALAFDADAKIVVVGGRVEDGTPHLLLARYNTDGALDTTFGINGFVVTEIGFQSKGTDIFIQDNGAILVSGYAIQDSQNLFVLAKYTANGSLDNTFGAQGVVTSAFGNTAQAFSIAQDSSENIILVGVSDKNVALARYTSSGALDTTFNGIGTLITNFGVRSQANAVVIDENDKIIITGYVGSQLLLARYTNSGSLDTLFGSDGTGYTVFLLGTTSNGADVILQPDGKIVVVGFMDKDFLIARYSTDGSIDSSWGANGIVSGPGANVAGAITQIWEQQLVGTNGGTFTADVWQTRTLNMINSVYGNRVSLNNNQFTIPAGRYSIYITAPAYKVGNHQIRLRNITDDMTMLVGTSAFSGTSVGSVNNSIIDGLLSLNKSCVFEVQHKCSTTEPNDGLGIATGFGEPEVYTTVKIVPH